MSTVRYTTVNGEVLAEKRSGTRREYVPDPLGSTVALLDNTQAQTDTFSYWPYGEVNVRTGSTPTPFQFVGTAGYYQDSSSKSYVRARHLDTQKGRWLTQDPIGLLGGDLNLFRYADNRPVTLTDPNTLFGILQYSSGTAQTPWRFAGAYLEDDNLIAYSGGRNDYLPTRDVGLTTQNKQKTKKHKPHWRSCDGSEMTSCEKFCHPYKVKSCTVDDSVNPPMVYCTCSDEKKNHKHHGHWQLAIS